MRTTLGCRAGGLALLLLACAPEPQADPEANPSLIGVYGFEVAGAVRHRGTRDVVLVWSTGPADTSCGLDAMEPSCASARAGAGGDGGSASEARRRTTTARWSMWIDLWNDPSQAPGTPVEAKASLYTCNAGRLLFQGVDLDVTRRGNRLALRDRANDPARPNVTLLAGSIAAPTCD